MTIGALQPGLLGAAALLGLAAGWIANLSVDALSRDDAFSRHEKPIVAAVNCVLWVTILWRHGPSFHALLLMVLVTALLVLSVVDLRSYLLPDIVTLPGIGVGIAATQLPGWPVSLVDAALSAAVGYFAMLVLAKAAELYYGREAIGQGDWKMVAMLGAFLGSSKLIVAVTLANGVGAVSGLILVATLGSRGRRKLPLGTFLGASGIVMAAI